MAQDPSKILLVDSTGTPKAPPTPMLKPHLVTVQYSIRVDAQNPQHAELVMLSGISFNHRLAVGLLMHGIQIADWTKENLEQMGVPIPEGVFDGQ